MNIRQGRETGGEEPGGARWTAQADVSAERPPLIDVAGVAKRLGTTERFVRRLVDERRVPFHKVGKFVRFDPRDIDAWLANNRVDAL